MQNKAIMSMPFLRQIALSVGAYVGDTVQLTVTLPDYSQDAACGLSLYPRAALDDHEILGIEHNEYEAIVNSDGGDYGIPACQVASYLSRPPAGATSPVMPGKPVRLWPGNFKNDALPCPQAIALIPIRGTREFTITLRRIDGATEIDRAYLWTVPIEDRAEHRRLCDGRKNLQGRPFWFAQKLELAAAAGVDSNAVQMRWEQYDSFALAVRQIFGTPYSNDLAGTVAYDSTYGDATLLRLRGYSDERLYPEYADERKRLWELVSLGIQDFDCLKSPELFVPNRSGFRIYAEREVTAEQKDIYLSFYGTLVDENVT